MRGSFNAVRSLRGLLGDTRRYERRDGRNTTQASGPHLGEGNRVRLPLQVDAQAHRH